MLINNLGMIFWDTQVALQWLILENIWGANISPGRTTRGKFNHIIGKIQNRLSGCKHRCLSLAGRLTLCKPVLISIPNYHMQYAKLPKTLCDEMEKIQRCLLWGGND